MKKGLKLTDEDISRITGNTPQSIQVTTSRKRFPRWAKLAVWVYEYFTEGAFFKAEYDPEKPKSDKWVTKVKPETIMLKEGDKITYLEVDPEKYHELLNKSTSYAYVRPKKDKE